MCSKLLVPAFNLGLTMKSIYLIFILLLPTLVNAQVLKCNYLNHDNSKGVFTATIDKTNHSVKLAFESITVKTNKCLTLSITADEVSVECDEVGNGVGLMLENIDGKLEGLVISEQAEIFAQADC